jgi:hypothetical protein
MVALGVDDRRLIFSRMLTLVQKGARVNVSTEILAIGSFSLPFLQDPLAFHGKSSGSSYETNQRHLLLQISLEVEPVSKSAQSVPRNLSDHGRMA